jgi:hypothetical protein
MMISKKELMSMANRLDNALMQPRQDECGRRLREVRDNMLLPNNLTFAEIFDWLLRGSNDNDSQPKVSQSEDNNLFDPTDSWVRPWAKKLEQNLKDQPNFPAKDMRHIIRMQEKRGSTPRTLGNIQWLRDIARREAQYIPPECIAYLELYE